MSLSLTCGAYWGPRYRFDNFGSGPSMAIRARVTLFEIAVGFLCEPNNAGST
jgi:hypothetical protein